MAQLPTYDHPQVQLQAAPSGALRLQAPDLGAALGKGISDVGKVVAEEQLKAAQLVAMGKVGEYSTEVADITAAFTALNGENAIKPGPDGKTPRQAAEEKIRAAAEKHGADLRGDAKILFQQNTQKTNLSTHVAFNAHERQAGVQAGKDKFTTLVAGDADTAAKNPVGEALTGAAIGSTFGASVTYYRDVEGMQEKDAVVAARRQGGVVATQLVAALATSDPSTAAKYIETHQDLIDGPTYTKLRDAVSKGSDKAVAAEVVYQMLDNPKIVNSDGTWKEGAALTQVNELMRMGAITPEQKELALTELSRHNAAANNDVAKADHKVLDLADGGILAGRLNSKNVAAFIRYNGGTEVVALAIQRREENFERARLLQGRQLRETDPEFQKQQIDALYSLTVDPHKLVGYSEADLMEARALLTPHQWERLRERRNAFINDPQLLKDVTIAHGAVNVALAKAEIISDETPTKDSDKNVAARAYNYIQEELTARRKDGPITPEIRASVVAEALDGVVVGRKYLGLVEDRKPRFETGIPTGIPPAWAAAWRKDYPLGDAAMMRDHYRRFPRAYDAPAAPAATFEKPATKPSSGSSGKLYSSLARDLVNQKE